MLLKIGDDVAHYHYKLRLDEQVECLDSQGRPISTQEYILDMLTRPPH